MGIKRGYKCDCGCIELENKVLTLSDPFDEGDDQEISYIECPSCHACYGRLEWQESIFEEVKPGD